MAVGHSIQQLKALLKLTPDSDKLPYDSETGDSSIGVEFAGTAVTAGRAAKKINDKSSAGMLRDNPELQWSESYYRGYYELHINSKEVKANYFGEYSAGLYHGNALLDVALSRYKQEARTCFQKQHR